MLMCMCVVTYHVDMYVYACHVNMCVVTCHVDMCVYACHVKVCVVTCHVNMCVDACHDMCVSLVVRRFVAAELSSFV